MPVKYPSHKNRAHHLLLIFVFFATTLCAQPLFAAEAETKAGKIISILGKVEIFHLTKKEWIPVRQGNIVNAGDIIRTGKFGTVSILLVDETLMRLDKNSEFQLQQIPPKAEWEKKLSSTVKLTKRSLSRLRKGKGWFLNKDPRAALEISTRTSLVGIRGTEIFLQVEPGKADRIGVLEGSVEVSNDFGSIALMAGEEASVEAGAAPVKS